MKKSHKLYRMHVTERAPIIHHGFVTLEAANIEQAMKKALRFAKTEKGSEEMWDYSKIHWEFDTLYDDDWEYKIKDVVRVKDYDERICGVIEDEGMIAERDAEEEESK